jgi:hypothetical protein
MSVTAYKPLGPMSGLFEAVPAPAAEDAAEILSGSPSVSVEPGRPYGQSWFGTAALLAVTDGFVIVRSALNGSRSIVTCDAGPGMIVLPPKAEDMLCALEEAQVTLVSTQGFEQLMAIPPVAHRIVQQIASTLARKQEALAGFGAPRHTERVRRKLLLLAETYGHVVRDGVRIDFPLTHALLAEMIASSRETVTRSLHDLEEAGVIARRGSTYRLLRQST